MSAENVYLAGTIRDRIQDIMQSHNITQMKLSVRIDSTESTLSRFIRLISPPFKQLL